jgi:high affinity sulfate transporter 1
LKLLGGIPAATRPTWLSKDLVAGLTVWAVLVPEALAYATIAGVPPVIGLYAAPAALILYALFGSSRHLVVGPMAATAALSAAVVGVVASPDGSDFVALTTGLALVVGLIALVTGLIKLGFLASFISEPVLKGFIIGLALTIIVGQLHKLIGTEGIDGNFFEKLFDFVRHLPDTHLPTLIIGAVSLAIVVGLKEFAPIVPGSLIAVAFGIAAAYLFDLDGHGVDLVGAIQPGLPPIGLPDLDPNRYVALAGPAIGVALVAFAEGLGAAKTYASRNHYEIDADQELVGLGASNLGAGLTSGMVVNGSLSKTAVNGGAGATSQVSGLVVAVMTVVTLLFLTGLFERLPEATLAAIVIAALVELVDIRSLRTFYGATTSSLRRIYGPAARADFIAAMAALLGVLFFDTLPGLLIGIIVSIVLLLWRASRSHIATLGRIAGSPDQFGDVERSPTNAVIPGLAILRPESGLFFANADRVRAAIRSAAAESGVHTVILDLGTVPDVDITAARMLAEVGDELRSNGQELVYTRDTGQVRDELAVGAETTRAGSRIYRSVAEAVEAVTEPRRQEVDRDR